MPAPLPPESTKGLSVKFHGQQIGYVEDDVAVTTTEGDYRHFLQRIRLDSPKAAEMGGEISYRWCYYSLTETGKSFVFGQYALLLSERQLQGLLAQARLKGWNL